MGEGLEKGVYARLLLAVLVSMFLIRVAFGVTLSSFALYLEGGKEVLGLVSSASPFLEAITVVFVGVLVDRYGTKGILLAGLGLGAVSLYGLALVPPDWPIVLALVNALHGVAAAFILVTTLAVIATYAPPEHRGREMGLFNFANIFGVVVGYAGGFVLKDAFTDRLQYAFVVAGALATVGLLFANRMIVLPVQEKPLVRDLHHRPSLRTLGAVLSDRRVILLIAPWLIVFSLVGALITFLPGVVDEALALSGGTTALSILGFGFMFVAAQLLWGRLSDKYGHEVIMLVGAVGFALLMGTIVYAFFDSASMEPSVVFASVMSHRLLLLLLLFAAFAFPPAGLAAIAEESKAGTEGTTMSAYSLTLSVGFIIGPSLVGFIWAATGGVGMLLFFAGSAAGLLALVATRFVQWRVTKRRSGVGGAP